MGWGPNVKFQTRTTLPTYRRACKPPRHTHTHTMTLNAHNLAHARAHAHAPQACPYSPSKRQICVCCARSMSVLASQTSSRLVSPFPTLRTPLIRPPPPPFSRPRLTPGSVPYHSFLLSFLRLCALSSSSFVAAQPRVESNPLLPGPSASRIARHYHRRCTVI